MSSNSYILSAKDQIALIDPGGLDDQMDHLVEKISFLQDQAKRPVVIYLTHVHVDHCYQLGRLEEFKGLGRILIAAQEKGASALQGGDSKLTLWHILRRQVAKTPVDIRLFSDQDIGKIGEMEMNFDGARLSYDLRSTVAPHGSLIESRAIHLGGGDQMEIYHIPGHSPDSICMRTGSILFIGDIFFAPNPGMAGAYGWSQPDLLNSIQKVIWMLENLKIKLCCCGHGRNIDADKAWSALKAMHKQVAALSGVEEVSPMWAKTIASYAEDLMRELERLFVIIAGRLTYISHILGELEEEAEAEDAKFLLDADKIDELFADFNTFVSELHAGKRLDIELVHKAGQVVGRLDKIFESKRIGSMLDQSLLTRAGRMLNDYTITYRGFRPPYYVSDVDVNELMKEVLEHVKHKPYEDEAILEAESDEDYLWALKARIAHIDLFEQVALSFNEGHSLPQVRMDKERFSDALIDVLERLAGTGARKIRVDTWSNEGWVNVRISGLDGCQAHPVGDRGLRFFERMFALCGGFLQTYTAEEGPVIEIEFVPSTDV
ncbi:MAG TPA: MBL fold metallo-hydrolase [Methanotrichaceae archaeon]|nr:MBL fold metallo-hydrolase [Methanotrichaceae archaeon]